MTPVANPIQLPTSKVIAFLTQNLGTKVKLDDAVQNALAGRELDIYELRDLRESHVHALIAQLGKNPCYRGFLQPFRQGFSFRQKDINRWEAHLIFQTNGEVTIYPIGIQPAPLQATGTEQSAPASVTPLVFDGSKPFDLSPGTD